MGAAKKMYTASRMIDRETGARLAPRPKFREKDFRRADRWKERSGMGRIATGGCLSRAVQDRQSRGRGLLAQGRWILAWSIPDNEVAFRTQSTKQFKNGLVPELGEGYTGTVELDEYGRYSGGWCSCPDYKKRRARLPNGAVFCKHLWFAYLTYDNDGLTPRAELPRMEVKIVMEGA